MKHFIQEYFTFNRREQRGIIALLAIIILLLGILIALKADGPDQQYDFGAFEKEIRELDNDVISTEKTNHSEYNDDSKTEISLEKFDFNPNNLPEDEWKKLGFSDKQIHTIKNYESKGGKFDRKEDLKKIYGVSETLYQSVEPYIQIPSQTLPKSFKPKALNIQTQNTKLELNTADSIELVKLKGIGPSFASRIIKYRNKLGGFIINEQLKEVYGIDSSFYSTINKQVTIDPQKIKQININETTLEQLKNHPYIKHKTANLIVNYRNKHGLYQSVTEIKNIDAVSDSLYLKLEPYLTAN